MNTSVVLCFSVVFLWSFGVIWSTITSSEENQLYLACTTLTWANQLQFWYSAVIRWFCNDIIFWKHRRPGLTLIHPIPYGIWPCPAAGQGMVFYLSVLNRVYNLVWVCPKQGMQARIHTGFHRFTEILQKSVTFFQGEILSEWLGNPGKGISRCQNPKNLLRAPAPGTG